MGSIDLFTIGHGAPQRFENSPVFDERELQTLVEHHPGMFLGVTYLASEFSTGTVHGHPDDRSSRK